ncbi:uncharacterized protein LOC34624482 [Cyclospora cayetanensis]|uniref:Uncharacterized protein LOC34624482 n=1 Tax=Cyclospora cayetanensis TaxID=88456 RepID=A0A6P6RS14_9EIME|nr:uncharacterized protein LOC34624482 [Cyclospora cayetanensis]
MDHMCNTDLHWAEDDNARGTDTPPLDIGAFLDNPQWWPQGVKGCTEFTGAAEGNRRCKLRSATLELLHTLRSILSTSYFGTIKHKACPEDEHKEGNRSGPPAKKKISSTTVSSGGVYMKDVPPCFSVFTRFNCNVTLVGQQFLAAEMAVSVLCSGMASVQGNEILKVLKYAADKDEVYFRHIMLSPTTSALAQKEQREPQPLHLLGSNAPFSYGFLVAHLSAFPPQVRQLVLSETLPFGRILDVCGIKRFVETDWHLHIHLGDAFFSPQDEPGRGAVESSNITDSEGKFKEETVECRCTKAPHGSRCTYGRLMTVWCDGQPGARVVEILNPTVVLTTLLAAEAERKAGVVEKFRDHALVCPGNGSHSVSISPRNPWRTAEERFHFLAAHCLHSVFQCPIHRGVLPKPHITLEDLLRLTASYVWPLWAESTASGPSPQSLLMCRVPACGWWPPLYLAFMLCCPTWRIRSLINVLLDDPQNASRHPSNAMRTGDWGISHYFYDASGFLRGTECAALVCSAS